MTDLSNVGAALSNIPQAAVQAGEAALNQAIKAVGLDDKEGAGAVDETEKKEENKEDDLEDGEIAEENADQGVTDTATAAAGSSSAVKTVFDDPVSFTVKHPLYSTWTLYYQSPQSKNLPKLPETAAAPPGHPAGAWMNDIKRVVNFDCVEDFWGMYNNIVPPSKLPPKADYFLFRAGIIPAWEDEANKDGGKWAVQMPRNKTEAQIDKMWLYTMLAAIGETFDVDAPASETELITGIILSSRPAFFRINVWTRSAPADYNEPSPLLERILAIGKHFKTQVLGIEPEARLTSSGGGLTTEVEFASHKDSEKKTNKNKVTV
jgi:translation initiation factor 4E